MLHWICPECGRECSPLLRECPACPAPSESKKPTLEATAHEPPASGGILALSHNLETIHAFPLLAAVPERLLVAANGQTVRTSMSATATATLVPDDVGIPTQEALIVLAEETLALPVKQTVDSLVRPLVESVEPIAAAEPVPIEREATQQPAPIEPEAAQPEVIDLETPRYLNELGEALVLEAETTIEAISAMLEMEREGIRAIALSFKRAPAVALLTASAEIVKAPAPPTFEWLRTARPSIALRIPPAATVRSIVAPPQAITLAGPCLPPQLRNFTGALDTADERNRKSFGFPALVVSVGVAMSMFLCTGTLLQYLNNRHEAAAAAPQAPAAPPEAQRVSAPAVSSDDTLAKSLEISGLRLVSGLSSKAQVQFLVVNHSARQLSDTAIQVAVKSSEELGAQPILTINALIHSLGPYQSKEVRADLAPEVSPSALLDWQSLHTEILTARRE